MNLPIQAEATAIARRLKILIFFWQPEYSSGYKIPLFAPYMQKRLRLGLKFVIFLFIMQQSDYCVCGTAAVQIRICITS
jgi:hypothetical protein